MSNELQEAAKRWRRTKEVGEYAAYIDCYYDSPHATVAAFAMADRELMADAYLAEHPEDDEEPVTEKWLDSVFGPDGLEIQCHDEWGQAITWFEGLGSVLIPMPKTRGDVRRLCKALGIPLKG